MFAGGEVITPESSPEPSDPTPGPSFSYAEGLHFRQHQHLFHPPGSHGTGFWPPREPGMEEFYSSEPSRRNSGESSAASLSPTGSGSGKARKNCEVCGDIAKSLHFGGLSCDSCKAFFRRSVHKDAYLGFQCVYENSCVINKQTRKSCQKCRFQRCLEIGMEKKWVMTEEERRELSLKRTEKKHKSESDVSQDGFNKSLSSQYIPRVDEMLDYMTESEQNKIREVCEFYRLSYDKIPYNVPKTTEGIRNSVQVIGMFTTILRRFAYFSKLIPEFVQLPKEDQGNLLKASVLEMVMLRGALCFDLENHRWPNTNLEFLKNCPQLNVQDMENLVSPELFEMHMNFIKRVQKLKVDEPTVMLLLLIVMFYPERSVLEEVEKVSLAQEKYCDLLKKYVNWRFGPEGKRLYPKLLTQLSDLRQLNDLHTEYHLNLAAPEVNVIRRDMSQLKLDPYPQWKIVEAEATGTSKSPKFPQEFSPPLQDFGVQDSSLQGPGGVELPPPLTARENVSETAVDSGGGSSYRPVRTSQSQRAHTRMREAFLRRIPQLIEDPFGPLITPAEMMGFQAHAQGLGLSQGAIPPGLFGQVPPHNPSSQAQTAFDPWQHRAQGPGQVQGQRPDPQTLQNFQQFQHFINDPHRSMFDSEKLANIQSIVEQLDPETKGRLQEMFAGRVRPGLQTEAEQVPLAEHITPGFFTNLFSTSAATSGEGTCRNATAPRGQGQGQSETEGERSGCRRDE